MENASKALLIAGSILISILIISLGVMIFRNMSGTVQQEANLDKQTIASFNAKITPYIGENISGSQVNALIQLVRTIDQRALNNGDTVQRVSIYYDNRKIVVLGPNDSSISSDQSRVDTGVYYNVKEEYGSSGLITKITVTK